MSENFKQYEFGENKNFYDQGENFVSDDHQENFQNIENDAIENNFVEEEINSDEEKNILENLSEEDKESYDGINNKSESILNLALSDDPIISRKATYSAISSAFANETPVENKSDNNSKIIKLISTKYKILAASILFSAMPLLSEAQHKQDKKEIKSENVFDESTERMAKKIFGWHKREKDMYIALETKKKILHQKLAELKNISPKTESEKSVYKMYEAERDAELANVEFERAKFNKELMNSDMQDPKVIAEAEAKVKKLAYQKSVIIKNFEDKILKFSKRSNSEEEREIESEIRKLEQQIDRLVNRQINHSNTYNFISHY